MDKKMTQDLNIKDLIMLVAMAILTVVALKDK
jgi:hypothetical protein